MRDDSSRYINFLSFDGQYPEYIKGVMFINKKNVFIKVLNKFQDTIKIFNFSLEEKKIENVNWRTQIYTGEKDSLNINRKYHILLENKFLDKDLNEQIFQFRLVDFGIYGHDDDITYFVGERSGVLGLYLGDFMNRSDKSVEVITLTKGDIYRNRIDYSKTDFGYRIK